MKRIVVIGGGTGTFTVLSGLRGSGFDLSAIVSTADDGGSTGVLRDELGVLPPGDVRQALTALSADSAVMRNLLNYRFEEGGLRGHTFGNLLLSALERVTGSFDRAILEAGKILAIKGQVIPVTTDLVQLQAQTDNGTRVEGQHAIDEHIWSEGQKITKLWLEPPCSIHPLAREAIKLADLVIIAPGSLFTSLIPNFLVEGMVDALQQTKAPVAYIANLMTERGQAADFSVQDCVSLLEEYIGAGSIDYVIYNTTVPETSLLERYKKEMERSPVRLDKARLAQIYRLVGAPLLDRRVPKISAADSLAKQRTLIRHNPEKLAEILYAITLHKDVKKYLH